MKGETGVSKRAYAVAGSILLSLCMTACMVTTRLDLPAWKAFREEMLSRDYIVRLEAEQGPATLFIRCGFKDISEADMAALKTELRTFLSSEGFLDEYVPYARGEAEKDAASAGVMQHMSNIQIDIYPAGTDRSVWMSTARYYTQPYRSDRQRYLHPRLR